MEIVNCVSHLQLHLLGEEWVQQVWDSDFMELEEFSNEYEEFIMENNVLDILEMIIKLLRQLLGSNNESEGESSNSDSVVSWELLVENKVEHRHLISLLAYFIVNGQNKPDDTKSMELCFKSCSLYYLLLAIPGCDAFFVFQPSVYEKTLKIFNIIKLLNETKPKKQSKGRRKSSANNDSDDGENVENDDGNDMSFSNLSAQVKTHIRKCVNVVQKDQLLMIRRYPLKVEDSLEKTLTQLISHTRLVNSSFVLDFDVVKVNGDASSFTTNSFCLLNALCSPLHGKRDQTGRLILYHLLPNILMAGDFVKDTTMHNLNLIRLQTEKFILFLLKNLAEDSYKGICVLVQHLCARVTDKADYRTKVSQSIVAILKALPSEPYFLTIKWLLVFAHDSKASHRLFSLEVISKLLYEDERPGDSVQRKDSLVSPSSVPSGHQRNDSNSELEVEDELPNNENSSQEPERDVASHKYLLGVLFSRCHDQSGTVRTKALSTLSDCLRSNNKLLENLMKEIFVTPYEDNDLIENENIVERGFLNTKLFLESLDKPQHHHTDPLPGGKAVVIEVLRLVEDDKVFVRKAAFVFLDCVARLNHKWLTDKVLKAMCDHVRDPALLIKKQLIQSLADLMILYPEDNHLATYYVEAVLPQISHPELRVQEKVLEVLESSILKRLVPFKNLSSPVTYLPWKLLETIIDLKKQKFFQTICSHWSKADVYPRNLIPLIQTHIDTKHNVAAWLFLSCTAPYIPIKNPQFIVEYYRENLSNPEKTTRYAVVKALDVLGHTWKYLPKDDQKVICTEFLESVENMSLSTTFIGPVLDVVFLITSGQASSVKKGQEAVVMWSKRILEKTEEYFQQNSPCKKENRRINMEEFMRNLVTLGDVAQLCPGNVDVNIAIILTGILFPEKLHDPVKWSVPGLQALTVVTLGKMCLQNECLAKRIIPALGLLLAESKHEAVKVNVINTLSDICIRFTAIVEPLLPEMCVCLKDPSVVVRHYTITVFVRLLQQDFLKLRGALLFHMMSMLVDTVPNIAQLANYYMTQCVVTRNKSIMYQNIVESVFYFNKYDTHPVYSKVKLSAQESHLFNMAGAENENKRQTLYRFMCEHMNDEHRMQATHKICTDILGGVTNETVVLDEKGESVLRDAFFVLSCEEICLHSLRTQSDEEPATDDAERVTAAVDTARKNIISQCVKKQVIELIIPIIVQLKGKLQATLSPLLTNLMTYLRSILKDYKNEIEEIFAEDKTMAEEILFDMKRFEEEQEKNRTQSQESDDEESGEVDHMRPLLVELVTSHIQQSMENQTNGQTTTENETVGSPGSAQPSNILPEGSPLVSKSPSDENAKGNESSSPGNNRLEEGKSSEENSSGKGELVQDLRQGCTGESNDAGRVRARSRTPTSRSQTPSGRPQTPTNRSQTPTSRPQTPTSRSQTPTGRSYTPTRSSSRNSQKRIHDETNDLHEGHVDTSLSASRQNGSNSSRRQSARMLSCDSNPESPSVISHASNSENDDVNAVNSLGRRRKRNIPNSGETSSQRGGSEDREERDEDGAISESVSSYKNNTSSEDDSSVDEISTKKVKNKKKSEKAIKIEDSSEISIKRERKDKQRKRVKK